MIRRLEIRREESAFSPLSSQQVFQWKPEVLTFVRENGQTGSKVLVAVNVSGKTQQIVSSELKGIDLLSENKIDGVLNLNPWECAWIKTASL